MENVEVGIGLLDSLEGGSIFGAFVGKYVEAGVVDDSL